MIALDTNILVYAFRPESTRHAQAKWLVEDLCNGETLWAVCWPSIHEFLATVTHPTKMKPAATVREALTFVELLATSPTLRLLHEQADHLSRLGRLIIDANVVGGTVHDARIATICLSHDVSELWTSDRDFARFATLRTRDPLQSA